MIQCSKITEPCEKLCSIMSYDDSIDGFGKTGLSVRESASLLGRKPNSISKSRKHEEVLDCLGGIATLPAELPILDVQVSPVFARVGLSAKKPRGAAALASSVATNRSAVVRRMGFAPDLTRTRTQPGAPWQCASLTKKPYAAGAPVYHRLVQLKVGRSLRDSHDVGSARIRRIIVDRTPVALTAGLLLCRLAIAKPFHSMKAADDPAARGLA